MKEEVYLGLGSNMGNREDYLKRAVNYISQVEGIDIMAVSNVYETDPVGYTAQDRFLNQVLRIHTSLTPLALLEAMGLIELTLQRVREIHWGPRTMDIDILLFGNRRMNEDVLTLPHPRMMERGFVLIPLREVYVGNDDFIKILEALISACEDRDSVRLFKHETKTDSV